MIVDPFSLDATHNEFLVRIHKDKAISATPIVLIKSEALDISSFKDRLKSLLRTAEYSSDEFIVNFTYQLAHSQRSADL